MDIQFTDKTPLERYHLLTQSVIPRPIAWILTSDENGSINLAPYSFFAPVSSEPPTLVVSMGKKSADVEKDSYRNLKRSGWCVVNIAHLEQLESMNMSSATLDAGVSESDEFGIELSPEGTWPLPRIAAAPVAYLCRYQQQVDLGAGPQHVVFLQIERMYVDEGVVIDNQGRLELSSGMINPIGRLGAGEYAVMGERIKRGRPD